MTKRPKPRVAEGRAQQQRSAHHDKEVMTQRGCTIVGWEDSDQLPSGLTGQLMLTIPGPRILPNSEEAPEDYACD